MSIQANVNQMLGTAGIAKALIQQSPGYKQKLEDEKFKKDLKEINTSFDEAEGRFRNTIENLGASGSETEKYLLHRLNMDKYSSLQDLYKSSGKHGKAFAFREQALSHEARAKIIAEQSMTNKQDLRKEAKDSVKKKRKSYLDQPTSLGGTVRDLNLSPEQKRSVRAQLKGGK